MLQETLNLIQDHWNSKTLDPKIWGYQIQPHTNWIKPGFTKADIISFEKSNEILSPLDLAEFIEITKGLDRPQIHVNMNNDLKQNWVLNIENKSIKPVEPKKQMIIDLNLDISDQLLPIYGHRFVVINPKIRYEKSKIISIYEDDYIIYANSLEEFLLKDFIQPSLLIS